MFYSICTFFFVFVFLLYLVYLVFVLFGWTINCLCGISYEDCQAGAHENVFFLTAGCFALKYLLDLIIY